MFDKFTDHAIKVIMLAQEEARKLDRGEIGTEFLLLGLVSEGSGIAGKALRSTSMTVVQAREEVEKLVGRGAGFNSLDVELTPRCKKVLEAAHEKAREFGDQNVNTEHLLLGILEQQEGFGVQVLDNLKIDRNALKKDILRMRQEKIEALEKALEPVFCQGDVFLVSLEITGEDGIVRIKRRPMVVISSDECNARMQHVTVVPLVVNERGVARDLLDIPVSAGSPEGKAAGLRIDSVVACTFVYTYPKSWFTLRIGAFPREMTERICNQVWSVIRSGEE